VKTGWTQGCYETFIKYQPQLASSLAHKGPDNLALLSAHEVSTSTLGIELQKGEGAVRVAQERIRLGSLSGLVTPRGVKDDFSAFDVDRGILTELRHTQVRPVEFFVQYDSRLFIPDTIDLHQGLVTIALAPGVKTTSTAFVTLPRDKRSDRAEFLSFDAFADVDLSVADNHGFLQEFGDISQGVDQRDIGLGLQGFALGYVHCCFCHDNNLPSLK